MKLKKILALLLSFMLLISLCSCGSQSVIATYDNGKEVATGAYSYYLVNLHNQYYDNIDDTTLPAKDWTIQGSNYANFIEGMAQTYLARYVATEHLFEKYNLNIDEVKYADNLNEIDEVWKAYGSMFEQNFGISKKAFVAAAKNEVKYTIIQQYLYGEGGEKAISEDEILNYYTENFAKVKFLSAVIDDKLDINALKEIYEGHLGRIEKGEDIQEIIFEDAARQNGYTKESARTSLGDNFGIYYINKADTNTYPEEFIKEVFECDDSIPHLYNYSDYALILYEKQDLMSDMTEYENNKEAFVEQLSNDDFASVLANAVSEVGFEINNDVLEKHSFLKVFG